MKAWLQRQQRRFMRPDAVRYLKPDFARYLAPERKWDGQPRLGKDEEGGGRYTFGTQNSGAESEPESGLPRVYIDTPRSVDDDGDGDEDGEGDGRESLGGRADIILGAGLAAGPGHNGGPPLGEPPEIPRGKPPKSSARTEFARNAATWIGAALGVGASIAAAAFIGVLNNIEWLEYFQAAMDSYRDPPRTMKELQAGVGKKRPGYEDHHIIEQTAGERWGMTPSEINHKSNLVSIPQLRHYKISGWYQTSNEEYGKLSPRAYLSDKGLAERRAVGLRALRLFEVLKK